MTFDSNLAVGRVGEKLVLAELVRRGCGVVPSYEFSGKGDDKSPRMVVTNGWLVLPDLDVCKGGKRFWCEVKTYLDSAYNRKLGCLVHGVKARLFEDYLKVQTISGCPCLLVVLEVRTGEALAQSLRRLHAYPCMCGECAAGNGYGCKAPIKRSVYFRRDEFVMFHTFGSADMSEIRRLMETPNAPKL